MSMLVSPTPEHLMLVESVRRYMERDYPSLRKAAVAARTGAVEGGWPLFANMGWLAAATPEDLGGLGGGALDMALIAEELGRGLALEPFVAVAGVAAALLVEIAPGSPVVEAFLAGEARPVLAAQDGSPAEPTLSKLSGETFVLTGRKVAIEGGDRATDFLVATDLGTPDAALFVVPAGATGVTVRSYRTIDDRWAADLVLDGAVVPASARLSIGEPANAAVRKALDRHLILSSAEMVGGMAAALDLTRDYLRTRRQFGQAIGDFQALRHRLADMFISLEQARSIVLRGVTALDCDPPASLTRTASAVKAKVGQTARFVTGQAIQLHGGIGVTQEHLVGHYYKRLTAFDICGGSSADHVSRFADLES
jgi:alkylation response protein AidB-like acyl-CoA dehydrogenase